MKLEDAIQQKEFRSDAHKGMVNLLYTSSFVLNLINEVTLEYNITRQQYNVLRILRGQHPGSASINLIKERMIDKMSDSSRLVERLLQKKLISKSSCENDKRAVDVTITNKGLELLDSMEPSIASIERIFASLSAAEIKLLNDILDKIRS